MHTDFLDNPVTRGDVIVYPTASGSSSAENNVAIIDSIDAIIKQRVPDYTGRLVERTTLESYVMAGKKDPTEYKIPRRRYEVPDARKYVWEEDSSKAYIVRVYKLDDAWYSGPSLRLILLKNVDRIIVVPRRLWGPEFEDKVLTALDYLKQNGIVF